MNLDFIKKLILAQLDSQIAALNANIEEVDDAIKTLEDYKAELFLLVADIEDLKKNFSASHQDAVKIVFFEIIGGIPKEETFMLSILKAGESKVYGFKALDAFKNETAVESIVWGVSDETLCDKEVSEDGKSIKITSKGPVGELKLQLACDGKIGEEVKPLSGEADLKVIAGDAVSVELVEVLPAAPQE